MKTFLVVAVYLAIIGALDLGGVLLNNLRAAYNAKPTSVAVHRVPGQTP